jgi:hypothetical protein
MFCFTIWSMRTPMPTNPTFKDKLHYNKAYHLLLSVGWPIVALICIHVVCKVSNEMKCVGIRLSENGVIVKTVVFRGGSPVAVEGTYFNQGDVIYQFIHNPWVRGVEVLEGMVPESGDAVFYPVPAQLAVTYPAFQKLAKRVQRFCLSK